jgi:hypothetical protein
LQGDEESARLTLFRPVPEEDIVNAARCDRQQQQDGDRFEDLFPLPVTFSVIVEVAHYSTHRPSLPL